MREHDYTSCWHGYMLLYKRDYVMLHLVGLRSKLSPLLPLSLSLCLSLSLSLSLPLPHPILFPIRYEFNESDLRMACDTLDTWLDAVAQGRTNLPPDKVPWSAFRTLLSQCIYGGRIDNDFDQVRYDIA